MTCDDKGEIARAVFPHSWRSWTTSDELVYAEKWAVSIDQAVNSEDVKFHSVKEEGWRLVRFYHFLEALQRISRTDNNTERAFDISKAHFLILNLGV